jgi:hypothetical protein
MFCRSSSGVTLPNAAVLACCCALSAASSCSEDRRGLSEFDGGRAGRDGGSVDASGADAGAASICAKQTVGIASASFGSMPLRLEPNVELTGPGVEAIFKAEENGLAALTWQRDRFLVLTDGGFWDLAPGRPATWIETSRIVHGAEAGDADGDGDFDLLLLSTGYEASDEDAGPPQILVTRLDAWERTPDGLQKRVELFSKVPGGIVGMPFMFADIDGDRRLDVLSFMYGEVVGYMGDGALGFTRTVLARSAAEFDELYGIVLRVEDRNGDQVQDFLAVLGGAAAFHNLVFLGDGAGAFEPHAPATRFETSASNTVMGDVTGDGLADILQQGFQDQRPMVRLTTSLEWSRFAPTVSVEPSSMGIELVDVDADGTLDFLTTIEQRLVAQVALGDGAFELRDLDLLMTANVVDFSHTPGAGDQPARLDLLYNLPCDPRCDARCFDCLSAVGCPSSFER